MTADSLGLLVGLQRQAPPSRRRAPRCWLAAAITVAGLLAVHAGNLKAAAAGLVHLRCTNPASGASWPIVIDLDRSRVNSSAATITDRWISWHDPNQGFFDLERATGKLQLRNASSTGGYFLHYQCDPE
ncbi:MAG: hypothetical protein JO081_08700 [Alphaproteobacteria bacterium]|nr:hypothetical protein [Alphaproteobacteria bacterium]